MSDTPPDLTNITCRFSVQVVRAGRAFRRDFRDLREAIRWRDEIIAQHPPARRGRPPKPGRRWTHGLSRYHTLRDHGLCVECKAPVRDGYIRCPACRIQPTDAP